MVALTSIFQRSSLCEIASEERVQVTYNALHNRDPQNPKKANLTDALEIRLRTDHGEVSDYARGLDLDSAIAWVEYVADGVRYRREFFASYPPRVLVMRLTASERGRLSFALDPVAPFLREGRQFRRHGRRHRNAFAKPRGFH